MRRLFRCTVSLLYEDARGEATLNAPIGRRTEFWWSERQPDATLGPNPPFPLALHRVGSVLAVKGSLRRFAPWTAPGRSERRAAYEGKGGFWLHAPVIRVLPLDFRHQQRGC